MACKVHFKGQDMRAKTRRNLWHSLCIKKYNTQQKYTTKTPYPSQNPPLPEGLLLLLKKAFFFYLIFATQSFYGFFKKSPSLLAFIV